MVDIETIRENYANMEDFQLLQVAEEGSLLSTDAFIILKREIVKRGLDTKVIKAQEELRVEKKKEEIRSNIDMENKKFAMKIWMMALTKKHEGYSDKEIQSMLVEEGVHPEEAPAITQDLTRIAGEILKEAEAGIIKGYLWLAASVVLIIIINTTTNIAWEFYYFAIVCVLIGCISLYRYSSNKTKMEKIISNINVKNEAVTGDKNIT